MLKAALLTDSDAQFCAASSWMCRVTRQESIELQKEYDRLGGTIPNGLLGRVLQSAADIESEVHRREDKRSKTPGDRLQAERAKQIAAQRRTT